MDPIQILLNGVLAPAVAAGLLFAIGWKAWRKTGDEADGRWIGSLAVAAAFALGFLLMLGTPASFLPDSEHTPTGLDWVLWCSLPCALLAPFLARPGIPFQLLRMVLGAGLVRLVLSSQFESTWVGQAGLNWLAGLTALFLVLWTLLERLASARSGLHGPIVLWLFAAGFAILAGLTGSAKIGQLGGTLAAALGAAVVIAWRKPGFQLAGGAAAMVSLLLFSLGLNAYFYSYTPAIDILLIASAPLFALMPVLLHKHWSVTKKTIASLALSSLPIGIAIGRAVVELLNEVDEYDY